MKKSKLTKSMSEREFDNGYWYATEVKAFAKEIGLPATNRLRKDELEKAIKNFLRTGKVLVPTKRNLSKSSVKDIDLGLSLKLPVVNYTSNKETKNFIVSEAKKLVPDLGRKSGARYRLNRWREEQLTKGVKITYEDLVRQYIKLNQKDKKFERIPSTRYINFLSDFSASEKGKTREDALKAWEELKSMNIPKNYRAWKKTQQFSRSKRS
jgi:hypothetical protein